ncbi:MAG: DUF389 domain-containing protein [Planctomycetota bacterium]
MQVRKAVLLVVLHEGGCRAIPWALRIAAARGEPLGILCVTKQPSPVFDAVEQDDSDVPELVATVRDAIGDEDRARTTLYDCRGPKRRRAILDAARELGADELVLDLPEKGEGDDAYAIVSRLARAAPEDVLVLDVGTLKSEPRRVLVPQIRGGGGYALRVAARTFTGEECPVIALADPSALVRSKRVYARSRERVREEQRGRLEQRDPKKPLDEAVAETVRTSDLVLFEADVADRVPQLLARLAATREEHPDWAFAIGFARSAQAAGPGRVERALERLRLYLPTLDREERRDLHETLRKGGSLSADFIVMMMLSAGIASFGLVQSSASVVIGAMLVAPLMTPIIAAGMALVQCNRDLFRRSRAAMAGGVIGALVAATAVGLLNPRGDLTAEIVARGAPNLFDLGIAVLSGIAAAFSLARPGLAGTLVGVAIAVALVPPLASTALAATKGEFAIAGGAALLFVTNLNAILLGAAFVFRMFGLDAARAGEPAPPWVRWTMAGIALTFLPITYMLATNLEASLHDGIGRPWARPLSRSLREDIHTRLASEPDVELVLMAESEIEDGFGVEVVLASPRTVGAELKDDLRALIVDVTGAGTTVRILALRTAEEGEAAAEETGAPSSER